MSIRTWTGFALGHTGFPSYQGDEMFHESHIHHHFPQFLAVYFVKGFFEIYETHVQRLPSGPSFFREDSEAAKVIVRTSLWPETRLFLSHLEFSFGCDPAEDDLALACMKYQRYRSIVCAY